MIHRKLEQVIKNDFNKSKAIVVMGARQVGKTTALKHLVVCVTIVVIRSISFPDAEAGEDRREYVVGGHRASDCSEVVEGIAEVDDHQVGA